MKTLYIVRHAKTKDNLDDRARELLPLGIERTQKLGKYLAEQHCQINHIYTSTALRAKQTTEIIADQLQLDKTKIIDVEGLYVGSSDDYIDIIISQDNKDDSLMLVGHNPQVTILAQFFIPDFSHYMQTGACFCIDFQTDKWESIFTAKRTVRFYVRIN